MKNLFSLFFLLFFFNSSNCQDIKELKERIDFLERKVNFMEKEIQELQKSNSGFNNNKQAFEIKYEVESEDLSTDFLITFWDKDGKSSTGWFKSGWKYIFSTTDLNQQILIQAKPGQLPRKKVSVKVYVNNKLIKSDTKTMQNQLDGPSCQVFLSEL